MSATRIQFPTQQPAQNFADAIHQRLIVSDVGYAASAAAGQTKRWAVPYQDYDYTDVENPVLLGPEWYVNLKSHITDAVLTALEKRDAKIHPRAQVISHLRSLV